jgi:hypothetical protein
MTTRSQISLALISTLCAFPASATAEPYWYAYEGNDLPENEGWSRSWGNDDGEHHGDGAYRTIEDGILTMDSLYDLRVYDYAYRRLPGELDPDPGELFVAEWRLKVDETIGGHWDSKVSICSDDGWILGLGCFPEHIESHFEEDVYIPITPDVFHEYLLISWDMRMYELYIDDLLVHEGSFSERIFSSQFAWGDCVSGAASRAHWDYVRFGVVPEPCSILMAVALCACAKPRLPAHVEDM